MSTHFEEMQQIIQADGRFLARDRYIVIVNGCQLSEDYAARHEAFEAGYFALGDEG
jgi:hypothetical protein